MALVKKYKGEFTDDRNDDWTYYIWKEGYSGAITSLQCGGDPLTISYDNQDEAPFNPIRASTCTIRIIGTTRNEFEEFYTNNERDYYISVGRGAYQVWSGYIVTGQYREDYCRTKYEAELVFQCGLNSLKNYDFLNSGSYYTSTENLFTIIRNCIDAAGISWNYRIFGEFTEDAHSTGSNLANTNIKQELFINEDGSVWNCYDVVYYILKTWGMVIKLGSMPTSGSNAWWIYNPQSLLDDSTTVLTFNSLGSSDTDFTLEPNRDLDTDFDIINSDMILSYDRAHKKSRIVYSPKPKKNYISSGSFSSEFWSASTVPYYWTESGTTVTNDSGTLKMTGDGSSGNYIYTRFYVTAPSKAVLKFAYRTSNSASPANFKFFLTGGGSTYYWDDSNQAWTNSDTTNEIGDSTSTNLRDVEFEMPFPPSHGLSTNVYYELRLIQPTTSGHFHIYDNMDLAMEYDAGNYYFPNGLTEEIEYEETIDANNQLVVTEDIRIGDEWDSTYSVVDSYWGDLYDIGGSKTVEWDYGGLTDLRIQELLAKIHKVAYHRGAQTLEGTLREKVDVPLFRPIAFRDPENKDENGFTRKFDLLRYTYNAKANQINVFMREILYELGAELVTGWTNGGTPGWNTLTSSGKDVTSAIESSGDIASATSNSISVTPGKYLIYTNLVDVGGSSDTPTMNFNGALTVQFGEYVQIYEESSTTSRTMSFGMDNGDTGNFSCEFSIKRITGY